MKSSYVRVADQTDKIIGKKREDLTSICVRFGKVKKVFKVLQWQKD